MISTVAFTALIFTSLGANTHVEKLRGQRQGILSTEAVNRSKASQRQNSTGTQVTMIEEQTLVDFVNGMVSKNHQPDDDPELNWEGYPFGAHMTDFKNLTNMNNGEIFMSFLTWLVLYFLVAAYYHRHVLFYDPPVASIAELESRVHYKDFQEFKTGLFECGAHPDICFWSCLCPGIRWADTMSELNIHRFWPGFWLFTLLLCISWIPVCTVACHCIICGYMCYHRQEFRKMFEFDEQGGAACAKDCVTFLFCCCCAVAQEARQSRDACIANHPAIDRQDATPRHHATDGTPPKPEDQGQPTRSPCHHGSL